MKTFCAAAMLFLAARSIDPEAEDLFQIVVSNFAAFQTKNNPSLLFVSAMACMTCSDVRELLIRLHPKLDEREVVVGELDLNSESQIAKRLGLTRAPSLAFLKGDTATLYPGPPLAANILAWVDQLLAGCSKLLGTADELEAFRRVRASVVYHLPRGDTAALEAFDGLMQNYTDVGWGHSVAADLKTVDKVEEDFALVASTPKFAGLQRRQSPEAFTTGQIKAFVEAALAEEVAELTVALSRQILGGTRSVILLLNYVEDEAVVRDFAAAAKKLSSKLLFAAGAGRILLQFRDIATPQPNKNAVMILAMGPKRMNRFFCAMTRSELEECVDSFLAGKLQPYLMSEAAPKTSDGPVLKVVGTTFEREVIESDKSILLAVLDSHSRGSARFDSVLETLANELESPRVQFARIDVALNEVPDLPLGSLPALYLFPAGRKKQPRLYEGALSPAAVRAYIDAELKA